MLAKPPTQCMPLLQLSKPLPSNAPCLCAGISEVAGSQPMREWTAANTPAVMQWGAAHPGPVPARQSTCELECDACVEHIMNRSEVGPAPLAPAPS